MTHSKRTFGFRSEKGLSQVEISISLAAALVITSMAIPKLNSASQSYQLRSVASQIGAELRNARLTAINRNRSASLIVGSDGTWYYLDEDGSGTLNGSERAVLALRPGYLFNVSAPSTTLTGSLMGTSSNPGLLTNGGVAFNSRGRVVQLDCSQRPTTTSLSTPKVIYLRDPNGKYAAVSITSTGKVKSWILQGTNWKQRNQL